MIVEDPSTIAAAGESRGLARVVEPGRKVIVIGRSTMFRCIAALGQPGRHRYMVAPVTTSSWSRPSQRRLPTNRVRNG